MKTPLKFPLLLMLFLASFLVGCLQEDPQLQALRDERDAARKQIEELKAAATEKPANSGSGAAPAEVAALKKEVESLKQQLSIAQAEVKKAKDYTPEILSEEELLIRLRGATEEHRKAIREKFDVVNIVLSDFSMPEKLTHPYRCGVQYDLLEKSTGEPYHLDVNVRAPLSGDWEIPPVKEFETKVKKGRRPTQMANNNNAGNNNSYGGNQNNFGNNNANAGNQNNSGNNNSGGGFVVERVNGVGGGGVPNVPNFQQPNNQNQQPNNQNQQPNNQIQQPNNQNQRPGGGNSGPPPNSKFGNVSRDIKVNW